MSDNIQEHQMPIHTDDLTANIHGTGDFIIELKHCKWKVHKEKFMAASTFFAKAMESGRWKEGEERYIKLHDECPIMFARCIEFVYTRYYSDEPVDEWYGFTTRCATSPETKFLVTGEPFQPQDDNHGEANLDELVAMSNRYDSRWYGYITSHENRRSANHMPSTEREADIQTDKDKHETEIHIQMYQLADKYGVEPLQRHALNRLRSQLCSVMYDDFCDSVHRCYPDYDLMEYQIKEVLVHGICKHYEDIRCAEDEAGMEVKGWLCFDSDLCFMVMDSFVDAMKGDRS